MCIWYNELLFLSIKIKVNKQEKLICDVNDKENHVIHIWNLNQSLIHWLKLEKFERVVKFNLKEWLKAYIDWNTKFRKIARNDFEKVFYKLMNNSVSGKTIDIKQNMLSL